MFTLRQKIRLSAFYARSLVVVAQFLSDFAIPDYQGNSEVNSELEHEIPPKSNFTFEWKSRNGDNLVEGDYLIDFLFGGIFKDSESQIFGHVSQYGYTYEVTLMQFPFLPLLSRMLAFGFDWLLRDVCLLFHFESLIKLSCIGLSFVAFILAADVLYSLSRRVLNDEYLAYKSVLLFCLTPTAVLFTGSHVEAVLAAATFSTMLILEKSDLGLMSGLCLALCSSIHASGILNLFLVIHRSMKQVATKTILYVREKKTLSGKKGKQRMEAAKTVTSLTSVFSAVAVGTIIPGVWNLVLCLIPFAAFECFAYTAFCQMNITDFDIPDEILEYGLDNNFKLPGEEPKPDWCQNDPPVSYLAVLPQMWPVSGEYSTRGIDILQYLTMEQLPYLISSAPTIALIVWQTFIFFKTHRRFCFRLGLVDNTKLGMTKPKSAPVTRTRALPRECLVYVVQALMLALAGIFFIPIQISNRLILCSSPVLYWIGAIVTTPSEQDLVPSGGSSDDRADEAALKVEREDNLKTLHSNILLFEEPADDLGNATKIFFFGYCVISTIFHVNLYPWT